MSRVARWIVAESRGDRAEVACRESFTGASDDGAPVAGPSATNEPLGALRRQGSLVRRATTRVAPLLVGAYLLAACAAGKGSLQPPASPPEPAEPAASARVSVSPLVVTPDSAANVEELFEEARQLFEGERWAAAAASLDRILELDPGGAFDVQALYLAGVAHDNAGAERHDRELALQRFDELRRRHPDHALARPARLRSVRLHTHLEQWQLAGQAAQELRDHAVRLTALEQTAASAAQALAALADSDLERAEQYLNEGRNAVELAGLDRAGRLPRDVAALYFALGELRRAKAEQIKFVPFPANFPAVLERRAQLLLDAQHAYSDTMRAHDAHWSTMAGYRTGELYATLHRDVMEVPPPIQADSEARRQLFEGALRLRYSILLHKALGMIEHTLAMSERTEEASDWVERTRNIQRDLEAALAHEESAIERLPYTREQLAEALSRLADEAKERSRAGRSR